MKNAKMLGALLLSLAVIAGYCAIGQTTSGIANSTSSGVSIVIEPSKAPATTTPSLVITVTISNSTNQFLVRNYAAENGSIGIEIHKQDGSVPDETELGCKRHKSTKCGPNVQVFGRVHGATMIVDPGQRITFEYNIGSEYRLTAGDTYRVNAIVKDFVLVDASKTLMTSPQILQLQALSNYQTYNYKKIETVRSNVITMQMAR